MTGEVIVHQLTLTCHNYMYFHKHAIRIPACSAHVGITYKIVYKCTGVNNNTVKP